MATTSEAVPLRLSSEESRDVSPSSSASTVSFPLLARDATRYSSCSESTSLLPGATSRASLRVALASSCRSSAKQALALRTYALTKHGSYSIACSASSIALSNCPSCR